LEELLKMKRSYFSYVLLLTLFCLLGTVGFAQDKTKYEYEFCSSNNWSNGDKVSANDLRETTLSAGDIKVNSRNGRITVKGENRSDVLLRACVRAWAKTDAEAKSTVDQIRIETSGVISAEIPKDTNASVSWEILVPNRTNLDLSSSNGRITISDVDGQIIFKTSNGRVTLSQLAGDVRGETTNGRVTVQLAGTTWNGTGLNVKTSNGRVSLNMPSNYAANVEVGTNNGRFSSDFAELKIPAVDGKRRRGGSNKVNASVNGGGAPIRVVTNNGRVSVNSNSKVAQ
jgi:DUF4097 and DUF4098 domain-containing protein YvlB